jgi:uncharacterized protein YpmB
LLDIFKKPVVIIIIVVAIVIALVWSYLDKRSQEKKAEETAATQETVQITNLTNIDATEFDQFVKDEYATASSKALDANAKYQLSAIVIELPASLEVNSGTDRYVFTSDKDTVNNWVITFSQENQSYLRALIPKSDYIGNAPVMDTALWKFNFVTALQIAEQNGGMGFREANNLESVTLTLHHMEPNNWLIWDVEYKARGKSFKIDIDANSGKVIE